MCDFPYAGPNCTQTYAEAIGSDYSFYHGFFLASAILAFVFSSIQMLRSHLYTEQDKFLMQKRILTMSWVMSFFLLIQSIDPEGYGAILPPIVEIIVSSLTTYVGLFIIFVVIYHIIEISQENVGDVEVTFWKILGSIALIMTIVMSFLQVYVDRSIARGVKLLLFAVIIGVASYKTDVLFYRLYLALKAKNSRNVVRMVWYLGIFNFFIATVIIYQICSGIITIVNNQQETPSLDSDQIFFPLSELIGVLLSTSFMSKMVYDNKLTLLELPQPGPL